MTYLLLGIDLMENQVKEAKQMVEESDIKYDEVARKLAMVKILDISNNFILASTLTQKIDNCIKFLFQSDQNFFESACSIG